jgi:hypothetical protein
VKDILTGKKIDDKYGLGKVRTWTEFWDYLGLDPISYKEIRPREPWKTPATYNRICDKFNIDGCKFIQ